MTTPVLLVGEALIDIVQPLTGDSVEHVGGSPTNVAVGLARLGHPTTLATYVGTDPRGRRIAAAMAAEGVALTPGSTDAPHTSTATARLDETGAASYEFDLVWDLPTDLPVPTGGHVHTGSISATVEPGGARLAELFAQARERATLSYDPNCRPSIMGDPALVQARIESLIAASDVVKASDEDVRWLYDGADEVEILRSWLVLGPRVAMLTRGPKGALVVMGEEVYELPAAPVSVVDTVGAGDSFMSGLISGLLDAGLLGGPQARERLAQASWDDVQPAVERALACSAITVTRSGADPPRRAELPA